MKALPMSIFKSCLSPLTRRFATVTRWRYTELGYLAWLCEKAASALEYENEAKGAADLRREAEELYLIAAHKLGEETAHLNRGKR